MAMENQMDSLYIAIRHNALRAETTGSVSTGELRGLCSMCTVHPVETVCGCALPTHKGAV